MSDLISRQAVLDAIVNTESKIGYRDNSETAMCGSEYRQNEIIDIIKELPSAESTGAMDEAIQKYIEKGYMKPTQRWIPCKYHEITDEEREENGYPKDWAYHLDCEMPDDDQTIIVQTRSGWIATDICYIEDGYSLDSGWDWLEDIVAWMPLPEPYKGVME